MLPLRGSPSSMTGVVAAAWVAGRPVSQPAAQVARIGLQDALRAAEKDGVHSALAVHARLTLRLFDRETAPPVKAGRGKK
jgi:hypothetical protein